MLSLVIPAYKREKTIVKNLKAIEMVLENQPFKYEIILVVDGMEDRTYEVAKKLKNSKIKVFGYKRNQGKGYAVRLGIIKAQGDIIGFMDAGLDINPSSIIILLDFMNLHDADIVIGSKLHPDSMINYPWGRKILSWGYRTLVHFLFDVSVKDTQVGLKLFKRKVAKDVFRKIIVKKFAFDVEVLAVASHLGYKKIYEAPVKINLSLGSISSTNFWIIVFWFLWDTAAVFYRLNILRYYDKKRK